MNYYIDTTDLDKLKQDGVPAIQELINAHDIVVKLNGKKYNWSFKAMITRIIDFSIGFHLSMEHKQIKEMWQDDHKLDLITAYDSSIITKFVKALLIK